MCGENKRKIKGRFTDEIASYELLVPHKISYDGNFLTYNLPHFYEHDYSFRRRKRDYSSDHAVHYKVHFNGNDHHLELFPNYDFIAPDAISERHYPGSDISVSARQMQKIKPIQCHYTGRVRGARSSRAAISSCNGLSGFIQIDDQVFFIEPAYEYGPNEDGHHLHIIHTQNDHDRIIRNCGSKNWRSGWEDALRYAKNNRKRGQQNMNAPPDKYYLEILVVADKKFIDYHQDKDYENYILTIMNMASNLFHDSSTGTLLELNVVRIIYLDQYASSIDLEVTSEASKSLASFCSWQKDVNPKQFEHPQHHDIAVLLTRQDICEGDESDACQLLGLAYFTQVCNPGKSCSINEDSGLLLGVVVAHEIGHILGADHDTEEDSGCTAECEDNSFHVMSPIVKMSAYTWSKCTRKYFRELFENGLGDCLIDEPAESAYKYPEMLPGSVYDADYQCRFFAENSTICPIGNEQLCQKLFCKVSETKCRSFGDPPADGTKCGHDMWCYRRECVPIGKRPETIPGGWGDWNDWSDCSRTCGGGIQYAERECNKPTPKNGGLYCVGNHKKFQTCNPKSCGIGVKSFRADQCSHYDSAPFAGQFYTWKPFTPAKEVSENTCVLYCKRTNGTFAKLAPRAFDGTPCKLGTYDMCVSGVCNKVGCDWKLDSHAIEDNCGVCNGDGKDCEQITGVFSDHGSEYKKAIKIPKGARKVEIVEKESSPNFLAVAGPDGDILLNDDPTRVARDGEKNLSGNLALYEHTEPEKEYLYLPGPLNEELSVLVYFKDEINVGYRYEFYVHDIKSKVGSNGEKEETGMAAKDPEYHWEHVDWTECTARCDGGEMHSESKCISNTGGGEVNDLFCLKLCPKPEPMEKVCNKNECKIYWHTGDWAPCSGCKHYPGAQFRSVWCASQSPRWEETDILTSEDKCIAMEGPKPQIKQLCVGECSSVKCRHSRSFLKSDIVLDPKDVYNYRFFEKLFRKLNSHFKEPNSIVIEFNTNNDSKQIPVTGPEPLLEPQPEPLSEESPIPIIPESKCPVETPLNKIQNPDNTDISHIKTIDSEMPKCPVRCILDALPAHKMGKKRMMFLFPKRREFRRKRKSMKGLQETEMGSTIVIKDRIPENDVIVEEAKIKIPNTDWLSDYAYRKIGDRVSGTIDLDHEKVWTGENAIKKIEAEQVKQHEKMDEA